MIKGLQVRLIGFTLTWLTGLPLGAGSASAALVAHWRFDETSGVVAEEAVAGNDGVLVNFPVDDSQWQPGIIGNALAFDGTDDHVVHPFNLPRAQGTIAHWLMPEVVGENRISVYESDSPGDGALYDGFGDPGVMLEIHSGVDDNWQGRYQDGSGAGGNNAPGFGRWTAGEQTAVAGVWTHVAMTWNTAGDLVLYVNCQEVRRENMGQGVFAGLTTTERFIGRPSEETRFWQGLVDDIQIYDTALSRTEIEAAAQFCPAPTATLVQTATPTTQPVSTPTRTPTSPTVAPTATPTTRPASTPTRTPASPTAVAPAADCDDGCTVTPRAGGAAPWWLAPLALLAVRRRYLLRPRTAADKSGRYEE